MPSHPDWLGNLRHLLDQFLLKDSRPVIRSLVLGEARRAVLSGASLLQEEELVSTVLLPYSSVGLHRASSVDGPGNESDDEDVVRQAAVNLLSTALPRLSTNSSLLVLGLIEEEMRSDVSLSISFLLNSFFRNFACYPC